LTDLYPISSVVVVGLISVAVGMLVCWYVVKDSIQIGGGGGARRFERVYLRLQDASALLAWLRGRCEKDRLDNENESWQDPGFFSRPAFCHLTSVHRLISSGAQCLARFLCRREKTW
jgi:hypothetical protein